MGKIKIRTGRGTGTIEVDEDASKWSGDEFKKIQAARKAATSTKLEQRMQSYATGSHPFNSSAKYGPESRIRHFHFRAGSVTRSIENPIWLCNPSRNALWEPP